MKTDKSVFLEVFGDYPLNRVLDFLVVYEDFDYPMNEIASKSGVGYATLKLFWKQLVRSGMVKLTRRIGNARLYRIDTTSPIVKEFKELYWTVTEKVTKEMLNKNMEPKLAKILIKA